MPETLLDIVKPDGAHVVEKRASTVEDAKALIHEAEMLAAARHPGVVEVLGLEGDRRMPTLVTTFVDGPSLDHAGALDMEEVAGVVASVAATLADLHDLGLAHGAVTAGHVIIGPHGHTVLCGFGSAGRVGEGSARRGGASDPHSRSGNAPVGSGSRPDPTDDVRALGALIRTLVADDGPGPDGTRRSQADNAGPTAEALLQIAEAALADDLEEGVTVRTMASSVYKSVPGARLPRPAHPSHGRPLQANSAVSSKAPAAYDGPLDDWRRQLGVATSGPSPRRWSASAMRRRGPVTAGVVATLLVGIGVASAVLPRRSGPHLSEATSAGRTPPPTVRGTGSSGSGTSVSVTSAASKTVASTTSTPRESERKPAMTCPPVTGTLEADVDGDGCGDALTFVGGVLSTGSLRWAIGAPGDQIAVGDWSCRGARTLAVLRPSTGEVFRLEGWARESEPLTASAVARVHNAVAVRAADLDHDGCHELVVDVRDGDPTVIPRARAAQ